MRTLTEFLAHDKVVGNATEFFALAEEAQSQLRPDGFLEVHFAAEIVRDTWRLNLMSRLDETKYSDETNDARNRYRDRLNTSVRRNTMELRRLQTDRILKKRASLDLPTPASTRDILRFEKTNPIRQASRKSEPISDTVPPSINEAESRLHAQIEAEERRELADFAQRTKQIPRNAPCPCKSGEKYKRCCGKEAPPVLNQAA